MSVKVPSNRNRAYEKCDLWSFNTVRLQIAFLLSAAMTICALLRGHLGMALVCMMKPVGNDTNIDRGYVSSIQVDWTLQQVGTIHTAFYVGTVVSIFLATPIASRFGAKATIAGGIIVNIVSCWGTPVVVSFLPNYMMTAAVRFVMGLGQGLFVPCAMLMIAKWFPMHEKSSAMAIFSLGNQVGLSLAMFATAELCKVFFMDGWPASFFLYGTFGAVFLGLWFVYAQNKPSMCRRITHKELLHIHESEERLRALSTNVHVKPKDLYFSAVVMAICLSSFCQSFVMVSMVSYLPEYFRSVLKVGLSTNGIWSALPFVIQVFSKIGFAFVADYLKLRGVSINLVTKVSNSIASFGCAICFLLVCWVVDSTLIMLLLCTGLALTSAFVPGYNTSIVSIAPSHTAILSSYAQGYGQFASVLAPIIVGFITRNSTIGEWRLVFVIIAGVSASTGLFFQFFGSATVQPWAVPINTRPLNASTFTVHIDDTAELPGSVEPTPHSSFLSPNGRTTKRSPRVSIMDEDGEIVRPGEDFPLDGKLTEPL